MCSFLHVSWVFFFGWLVCFVLFVFLVTYISWLPEFLTSGTIATPVEMVNLNELSSRAHACVCVCVRVRVRVHVCVHAYVRMCLWWQATSEVGKAGNIVSGFFEHLVSKHVPELSDYMRRRHSSDSMEPERKRRRMTPSPGAGQTVHKGKASWHDTDTLKGHNQTDWRVRNRLKGQNQTDWRVRNRLKGQNQTDWRVRTRQTEGSEPDRLKG